MIQDIIAKLLSSLVPPLLGLLGLYKISLELIKAGVEKAKSKAETVAGYQELSKRIDVMDRTINDLINEKERRKIEEERIRMLIDTLKENFQAVKQIIGRYSRQKAGSNEN